MNETESMDEEVTLGKLVKDFKTVVQDAESLVRATAGDLGDKALEARKRLTASVDSAKASFARVEERAVAGAKATDRVIRGHPYESMGIAFGVGLLIGVLVSRK